MTANTVVVRAPSPRILELLGLVLGLGVLRLIQFAIELTPFTRQGFFCNDPEIAFPFRGDSITTNVMNLVYFLASVAIVVSVELSLIRHVTNRGRRRLTGRQYHPFHPAVYTIFYFLLAFFCAYGAVDVLTDFGKRIMSRLRPNFLAVCRPQPPCLPGSTAYVSEYTCAGVDTLNTYASFPSGRSACAVAYATIIIYYVHRRSRLVQPIGAFIQLAVTMFTLYVCLSRVRDYQHRLVDVGASAVFGGLVTLFFARYVLRGFSSQRYDTKPVRHDAEGSFPRTIIVDGTSQPKASTVPSCSYGTIGKPPAEF